MNEVLKRFKDLETQLISTTKRTEKENILKSYRDDDAVLNILKFVYDPYKITGLSSKKTAKILARCDELTIGNDITVEGFLRYFDTHKTGTNEDITYVARFIIANEEFRNDILDIVTKDLKIGVQSATLNKVFGQDFVPTFEVMLAKKYFDDPEKLLPQGTTFILTEKLDGVRCVCFYEKNSKPVFFSRQGQLIEGLNDIASDIETYLAPGYVYDGELLSADNTLESKDRYRATVKIVNSNMADKKGVIYNIFDIIDKDAFEAGKTWEKAYRRKRILNDLFSDFNVDTGEYVKDAKNICEVPCLYFGEDQNKIQEYLDKITDLGGEGVMINLAQGQYEYKRTNQLLKVKKMQTCDLLVLAVNEGTGANAGKLGSITVEFIAPDDNHYTCDCGSGFCQEDREYFWKHKEDILNKIVEVQYFEISNNQEGTYSLRFPVFLHVRNDKSEISMN